MYYYVQKEGAYPQGVFGIFEDKEGAMAHADKCADLDRDDYHEWCVYVTSEPKLSSGVYTDETCGEEVYSVRKGE